MYYTVKNIALGTTLLLLTAMLLTFNGSATASVNPKTLTHRVEDVLSNHYNNYFNIKATKGGDVRIEGTVNSLYKKYRIFDIVARVPGVKKIEDFVSVNTQPLPDDIIKYNLEQALDLSNTILDPSRIKVQVANGIIILSGKVSEKREKVMAETMASWQKGAVGIINNIKVLPTKIAESDRNITDVLDYILHNQFPMDGHIRFTVHRGIVKVTGSSDSFWTKHFITHDFRKVKGVREVINDMKV